jgi:hypothetical protein
VINIKVTRAVILKGYGPDKVFLRTDLPEACWPYDGKLSIEFSAGADTGKRFCKDVLHLDDKDIDVITR